MIKIDKIKSLLEDIVATSELSKNYDTPLVNRILKLAEETGELSQSYLKYSGSVNASKSGGNLKLDLIEESSDVLLVILDILNNLVETEEEFEYLLNILEKKNNKWKSKLS